MSELEDVVRGNARRLIEASGLTQTAVAHALGRYQSSVSERLRGVVPFTLREVDALAAVLGVDRDELLRERQA